MYMLLLSRGLLTLTWLWDVFLSWVRGNLMYWGSTIWGHTRDTWGREVAYTLRQCLTD